MATVRIAHAEPRPGNLGNGVSSPTAGWSCSPTTRGSGRCRSGYVSLATIRCRDCLNSVIAQPRRS